MRNRRNFLAFDGLVRATHGGFSQLRPISANWRRIRRRSQNVDQVVPAGNRQAIKIGALAHPGYRPRVGGREIRQGSAGRGVDQAHQLGGRSNRQRAAIRALGNGARELSAIAQEPPGALPGADLPGTIIDF
jgi:hypothetical protein